MSALTIEIPKQSDIKVRVRKCEETWTWCEENCNGDWSVWHAGENYQPIIFVQLFCFEDETDALAFKLMFGDELK